MKENKTITMKVFAVFELLLLALFVIFDMFLPTILVLGVGLLFIILRREKISITSLGKGKKLLKTILCILSLSILWTLINFCIIMPILSHLTGTRQDVSDFANLKGNVSLLLTYLIASWILAALGEEFAYRGIIQNRLISLFTNKKMGLVVAVLLTSILFGLAHTEQGIVGIITATIDAIFFNILIYKFKSIWASVLVHGFMNSIGFITFFFTGAIYGLW